MLTFQAFPPYISAVLRLAALLFAALHLAGAFIQAAWQWRGLAWRNLALPDPTALTPAEKRRFRHYFFGTTYLATVFMALRGRRRTQSERRAFTRLAALAAFFDDLSDRPALPTAVTTDPEAYGRSTDPRGLAWHLLTLLRRDLPPASRPGFEAALTAVFRLETAQSQASDGAKGGHSVLLFRHLQLPPPAAQEAEALYEFGRLVQLCDDIFDVWFDRRAGGAPTLALDLLEQGRVGELTKTFEQQVAALKTLFASWPRRSWLTVHFLVAVTRVALQHYRRLLQTRGQLPLDDRAAMVVDMGRWPNRWRALRAVWRDSGGRRI